MYNNNNSEVTATMSARNVDIYDTVQPLNVFGSLSDWATSASLTGGKSPDPVPSSCIPGFPSLFGAFCSIAMCSHVLTQQVYHATNYNQVDVSFS